MRCLSKRNTRNAHRNVRTGKIQRERNDPSDLHRFPVFPSLQLNRPLLSARSFSFLFNSVLAGSGIGCGGKFPRS